MNQICSDGACQDGQDEAATLGTTAEPNPATTDDTAVSSASVEKERIKPLWLSGLITFSTIYVATIVGNAVLSDPDARGEAVGYAFIPMFGPFISLGNQSDDIEIKPAFKGLLVTAGILQIVGVGLFTAGMIIKREPKDKQASRSPRFWVTPALLGDSGAGAAFTMTHF
ncbi:MAG: hypothetical protein JXR45_19240 [Deltaproteobacteria bacterium]|nr:hypothetical protein [Deltaproteobacteria bacterium]